MAFRVLPAVLLLAIPLLAGCATRPYVVGPRAGGADSGVERSFHVVSHGWHTGFVIPADAISGRLPALRQRFGEVPFYEVGWGDAGFYQAKEITTGLSLKAMFLFNDTVLHVVAVPSAPERFFQHSDVVEVRLPSEDMDSLITFIERSFARDGRGDVIPLSKGLYGESQFYQAEGEYYLLNTCNSWTAKGLRSAGLTIVPGMTLTAQGVMNFLRSANESGRGSAKVHLTHWARKYAP